MAVLPIDRLKNNSFPILISLLVLTIPIAPGSAQKAGEIAQTPAASLQNIGQLEQGKPIERQMAGSEKHTYQVTVQAGQYLQVAVQQKGIDLVVRLFAPDGKQMIQVDDNYAPGSESIQAVAETSGNYRVEIQPLESSAAAGGYEVKIEELREATVQDTNRIAARQAFREAHQLRAQGTLESLQQAIEKYKQAIPLFQAVGDKAGEARTLNNIGLVYDDLGEKQKALEYYNQSLPLSRAVGDKAREAVTLNNIGRVYDDLGEKQKALEYYNQSLPLSRAVGDKAGEAATLHNIGSVYDSLGEKQKALEYYNQSLPLRRAVGDKAGEAATLSNIGSVYYSLGEKQKVLEYYNQSLPLMRAVGDKSGEAATLNNIGYVYSDLGEKQKALEYFNQSLSLFRAVGEKAGEAATLNGIGNVYADLGEKQKALDYYNQSLPLFRAVGDKSGEAVTLNGIGLVYSDLGEKQKALEYYNQALPLLRAVGDKDGEAITLSNIGAVYEDLGEKQKALDYYNQSLPLRRAVGDKAGEAVTLNGIGLVYSDLGEKQKALEYYNQSLPLRRAVGDKAGEAATLHNIGSVYNSLGEKQKALEYYNQSLPLRRAVGDKAGEATTLNNIGLVYNSLGEKQKALEYYNQSLPLFRAVGYKAGEAATLSNIGLVYDDLGEKQKALEYYNQSLPLSRVVGDKAGEAATLSNIGGVYSSLGEKQKALEYYNQSLPLSRAVEDKAGEAATLNNIGSVYDSLGEKQKALEYYNQSLPLSRAVGNKAGEALILNNISAVYNSLGEKQKALDYLNQSLPLSRAVGDKAGEAVILYNFAFLQRSQGNLQQSLSNIEAAISIIESLRTKVTSQELRTSFFASKQDYYQFYIDLLMQLHKQQPSQGYDTKALETSERSRARSLLELLTEANADIRQGVDPELLQKERTLQAQLNTVEQQRIKTLSGTHTDTQAKELETQLLNLQAQYQEIQTEIRVKSPKYAALTQPQPLKLAEIQQQVLDDNSILLEYSIGEERSYLWAVTKTEITSYELPKSADIEAAAKELRQLLTDSEISQDSELVAQTSAKLSQIILAPVAEKLGQKRLVIVADGILQYIPFAALTKTTASKEYIPLIIDHEIVNLPSASMLAISRKELQGRTTAPKTIAVLADPVFGNDDDRLQTKAPSPSPENVATATLTRSADETNVSFNRLKFTALEANAIIALVSDTNLSQETMGFAADRNAATSPNLAQYRIVHFATHGIMNPTNPELSGLVMSLVDKDGNSANGFLRLNDIFNLQLSADLVVMSACQTATGKEVKGEGIVGLTRGFMYAGAARVMASLWSVNDPATSQLMTKFYQRYLKEGLPAAAALRAAQLEMFKQGEWRSPYYWSAFTLQGEWK